MLDLVIKEKHKDTSIRYAAIQTSNTIKGLFIQEFQANSRLLIDKLSTYGTIKQLSVLLLTVNVSAVAVWL